MGSFILPGPPVAPRNESYVVPTPMVRTNSWYANQARTDSFYPKQPPYAHNGPGASFYGNQMGMPFPSAFPPERPPFYGNQPPKAESIVVQPKGPLQVPDRRFVAREQEEESESE